MTAERPKPPVLKLIAVTPRQGPIVGGVRVTVSGRGFDPSLVLKLGATRVDGVEISADHHLEFVLPPAPAPGYVDIELRATAGSVVQEKAFLYEAAPPPAVHAVTPNRGPTTGGIDVRISGENFVPWSQVLIQGKRPLSVILVDQNTLEIIPPPGADGTLADITVRNPDGAEATLKRAFRYDKRFDGA